MGSGSDSDDSDVALSAYAQVISSEGEISPVEKFYCIRTIHE